jgi:tetratricopeptide (TPR) repeat protein
VGHVGLDAIGTTSVGEPWLPAWWDSHPVDLSRCAFLDTETTGLHGGAGTYVFLVGVGYVEQRQFVVQQFFLRDLHEERAMLTALNELWDRFDAVITFNGRSFDVPLLKTRHMLQRSRTRLPEHRHLDLLWPARRLWKDRLASCALTTIERDVFGAIRRDDVPGSLIPELYFRYVRSKDARTLRAVFEHNRRDITALAALAMHLARLGAGLPAGHGAAPTHPMDLAALGAIYAQQGNFARALEHYVQAVAAQLPSSLLWSVYLKMAAAYRAVGAHDEAVHLWEEIARCEADVSVIAAIELAKHLEHRRRDPEAARRITAAALEEVRQTTSHRTRGGHTDRVHSSVVQSLEHRLQRLEAKCRRVAAAASVM